ncbi:LysR family transcriptional regulator [Amycolatopsis sp. cmx-8-4]|uniref:LysR family transcriptional regulator n=1 Tax=Amycolatopsis sp. cmx-8-4 TaxID=2790947 RepID=UPI00397A64CD
MADLDLNLLVVLDALLTEGSVTGAAERLHLSVPATSRALGRLRRTLDDEVLVRAGRVLVPTPAAVALRDDVRGLVERARGMLRNSGEFDLATLERTFVLRANDSLVSQLGPGLIVAARATAPGVRLRFVAEGEEDVQPLRDGRIDLDLGMIDLPDSEIVVEQLWREGTAAIAGPLSPLHSDETTGEVTGEVTLQQLAAQPHLAISRRGRTEAPFDAVLAEHGLSRDVVAVVPTPTAALNLVLASDLVCLTTSGFAAFAARVTDVQPLPVPADLPLRPMAQAWHPRFAKDPGHRWLRARVRDAAPTG